jgi:hypothetical protein
MAAGSGRVSETDSYRRDHLIRVIERCVEGMTLKELEAMSYDMFTKGYIEAEDL